MILLGIYINLNAAMVDMYLVHEEDAMEAERDDMLGVRPVYRSHVRGIEQHDVALLSRSIKPNGHQDSIIFLNTIWVGTKLASP